MLLYVALDLLVLPELKLPDPLLSNTGAAAAETERFLPPFISTPESLGFFSHSLVFQSAAEGSQPAFCRAMSHLATRIAYHRPRAPAIRETDSTIPPPEDPV